MLRGSGGLPCLPFTNSTKKDCGEYENPEFAVLRTVFASETIGVGFLLIIGPSNT